MARQLRAGELIKATTTTIKVAKVAQSGRRDPNQGETPNQNQNHKTRTRTKTTPSCQSSSHINYFCITNIENVQRPELAAVMIIFNGQNYHLANSATEEETSNELIIQYISVL